MAIIWITFCALGNSFCIHGLPLAGQVILAVLAGQHAIAVKFVVVIIIVVIGIIVIIVVVGYSVGLETGKVHGVGVHMLGTGGQPIHFV